MKSRDEPPIWLAFSVRRHRFVIVGHTHCPGAWKVPPRVIINTGSFVPYFGACAAIIESGRIEVRRIDFRRSQFIIGKLIRNFAVEPVSTQPATSP